MAGESPNSLIFNAGMLGGLDTDTVANLPGNAQLGLGVNLPNIDAVTPLILPPAIMIVMNTPTMFDNFPYFNETLKALVEEHAREITGIDFGYQMESSPTPAGHDGQNMEMPTNARRTPVSPVLMFQELTGNLVWNFHRTWMNLIKSADTQGSVMGALLGNDTTLNPQLFSSFTMDMLVIQPDTTLQAQNIVDAYFIMNMWPFDIGNGGFQRQIGQSTMPERTINFHGIVQHNANTKAIGQQVMQTLQLSQVNYNFSVPVELQVDSRLDNMGLASTVQDDLASFTQV